MADLHIKPSGSWKSIDSAYVKVSGAWKDVQNVYVKVSGAWKLVWQNWVVSMPSGSATGTGASPPTVGIQTRTDGMVYKSTGGAYASFDNWIDPASANADPSSVHIRFTEFSKDANFSYSSITPDGVTWYDVQAGTRTVNGVNTGAGSATAVVTCEISLDGGSSVHDTGTWTLESSDLS